MVRNDRKTRLDSWGSEGVHQMGIWDCVTSMRVYIEWCTLRLRSGQRNRWCTGTKTRGRTEKHDVGIL